MTFPVDDVVPTAEPAPPWVHPRRGYRGWMRQVYAHHATLVPVAGGDPGAPGAALTTALCGHLEHDPPCPLAPHHTAARPDGDRLHLRILFATEPHRVADVRTRIDSALAAGDWALIESGCARVDPDERPHARRLLRNR